MTTKLSEFSQKKCYSFVKEENTSGAMLEDIILHFQMLLYIYIEREREWERERGGGKFW